MDSLYLALLIILAIASVKSFKTSRPLNLRRAQSSGPSSVKRMHVPKEMEGVVELGGYSRGEEEVVNQGLVSDLVHMPRRGRSVSVMKSVLPLAAIGATLLTANSAAFANGLENAASLGVGSNDGGFLQSFLLIFISEIGDKTFFIAGLLAAKYGRFISFTGSIGALAVMTVLSTILGQIFHAIPPSLTQGVPYDDVIAVAAFAYFGLKTLYDSSQLKDEDNSGIEEEKAEAEEVVENLTQQERRESLIARLTQTFGLVFAAEIGDRSFLSTIALSAALNPYAVATGAIAAHMSATGIAVAGGVFLSKYLSEKVIGYISAALFLIFAATTALGIF